MARLGSTYWRGCWRCCCIGICSDRTTTRTVPSARAAIRNVVVGLIEAGKHVGERPPAAWGLAVIGAHRFFYGISTVAMILLCRNYFHEPAEVEAGLATLATVLAVSGVGFVVAALATPVAARRMRKESWIVILLVTGAVVSIVPGALFTLPAVLIAAFFLGVVAQGIKIVVDTLVQQNIDDAFRGRVFSFYDVLFNVTFVAAATFGALTLPSSGKSLAVTAIVSAGYGTTAFWYRRVSRRVPAQTSVSERADESVASGPTGGPTSSDRRPANATRPNSPVDRPTSAATRPGPRQSAAALGRVAAPTDDDRRDRPAVPARCRGFS